MQADSNENDSASMSPTRPQHVFLQDWIVGSAAAGWVLVILSFFHFAGKKTMSLCRGPVMSADLSWLTIIVGRFHRITNTDSILLLQ